MPVSGFGVSPPPGVVGEFGTVALRVGGHDLTTWREFSITQHFLTPTDGFRFVVGADDVSTEVRKILKGGTRVEILIDGIKQLSGYITKVAASTTREAGSVLNIEGFDAMWPATDSQIDPDHHYPDKTPLEQLIKDVLGPFGFTKFEISNEDNVDVAANRALKQKRVAKKSRRARKPTAAKPLSRYPIPKSKPQHNDTYFQFLSRITHRYSLWIWPSVDGDTAIVGKPNYDQEPIGQLRMKRDGLRNNVIRGGITRDYQDQPSFIVARGNIPAKHVEHSKMRVIVDNPYTTNIESVVNTPGGTVAKILGLSDDTTVSTFGETGTFNALNPPTLQPGQLPPPPNNANAELAHSGEAGTFNSLLAQYRTVKDTWTTVIPSKPIQIENQFASTVARPRFIRDKDSRTIEELENFAKRQMSLCTRKAFVGDYTFVGFYLDGQIPQVDTIVDVDDEMSDFRGPLWVLSRELSQSRQGGTSTTLQLLPLQAIQL